MSENTVFYEKLAEAIRKYPYLYEKSRLRWFQALQIKKTFCVSTVNWTFTSLRSKCSRDKKLVGKKYLASSEQQKQQENFVFHHFEKVPRPILPRLHSGAACACVCHFPCAYACAYVCLFLRARLYTWKEGAPANRATGGGLTTSVYVSLENALKHLHARQGSPPTRGTLSTCPKHLARRDSFASVIFRAECNRRVSM